MLLVRKNLNQKQLAWRLGVSAMWVSGRLTGQTEIGLNDLPRIAEALGVKVVDLLPRDLKTGISVTNHPRADRPPNNRPNGGPRERPERGDLRRPRRTRPPRTMVPTRSAA